MPLKAAGSRTDPPVSSPMPAGAMRAAIAAPLPPLEPPGMRAGSYGLRTKPKCGLLEVTAVRMKAPPTMSMQFAFASITAPARIMMSATFALRWET
jgi:hypothetical protein